ncbi:mobile mystery protein A [Cytophaga aurantiaca]|uniref:mobile mystery protein A n=1 Tax=Cytophaga aurantiaca TaxID=29530 RepID=UPI0003618FB5|nr:mobile mystery protein A [Cytophaga aurantiaca]
MKKNKLQIEQLSQKIQGFGYLIETTKPTIGWIKTIRTSLGMSLEQIGNKLNITRQSAQNLEKREAAGAITLKSLEEAANALDMKLVYALVPKDGSIEKLIERKANQLAVEIVMRTSGTMKLEDQENSPERIKKAIAERTSEIIDELPKMLWD